MEEYMKIIGERIRDRRKELHLTQTDIYVASGISTGALSEIENGNRTPSIIIFQSLATVLKCSMDWLATGEPPKVENICISASEDILNDVERKFLKGFRQLDQGEQEELIGLLSLKLQKAQKNKEKNARLSTSQDSNLFKGYL